ncbi:MAG TPA: hypothetical protein VH442_01925 [Micromonosporaceae bacterium]|jgi:hypothetical protein
MTRVTWDGTASYEMILDGQCDASPASVYAVLSDLSTHLDWGGRRQRRSFRLTSLDASGLAAVGTKFATTGSIPMSSAHWSDRNIVVRADAPTVFEFHTESVAGRDGRQTHARWEHRYRIVPEGNGSRVSYRLRRTSMTNPPLRMRAPLMRTMTHRVMIPFFCRRGFTNLLDAAVVPARAEV